ncbi:MAG: MFS transporter, partial [Bacilli bacterium]|nr:MFS transporter [Bacilli bacterium]
MRKSNNKLYVSSAIFIILMGIISMLSDMTHEGAKSIYGSFLGLVGASPSLISIISGLGEFIGCSLILLTGYIASKTKRYWIMTAVGYSINLLAIPLLAFTMENGYIYACSLILLERFGKAIRKPAKSTLVSFSSKNLGEGKSFALVEFLDQIGAFIGPLILTLVLYIKGDAPLFDSYKTCFLVLGIPAILTLVLLLIARIKYPHPESLEVEEKKEETKDNISKSFYFYLIAISFCAFGFIDFPLITYHVETLNLFDVKNLPLLYSLAMLIDAFAALL